jgi:hypothetical protein
MGHHLTCQCLSMAAFDRDFLAHQTGRSVTDKATITSPTLFVALQEQLGLKPEPQKGAAKS